MIMLGDFTISRHMIFLYLDLHLQLQACSEYNLRPPAKIKHHMKTLQNLLSRLLEQSALFHICRRTLKLQVNKQVTRTC